MKLSIDDQCIDCKVCIDIAPDNFSRDEDKGMCFVTKQPVTEEDEEICEEAMELCPTMSIVIQG